MFLFVPNVLQKFRKVRFPNLSKKTQHVASMFNALPNLFPKRCQVFPDLSTSAPNVFK